MRILVTGGVRSGKSAHAESLMAGRPVTYIAPGPTVDDDDWAARVLAHQARRPASWTTLETGDLVAALDVDGPVLIDCLGTWLTRLIDVNQAWDLPSLIDVNQPSAEALVSSELDRICTALATRDDVVVVTNEVGLGVVPEHRSGRLFRDLLGLANQRVAAVCDEVHLVVAGRVLRL